MTSTITEATVTVEATEAEVNEIIGRARPYTRIETKASFEVPAREGYEVGYVRNRTKTVVYRALDKSGWLVVDTRDGSETPVANTVEARKETNKLEAALKAEVKETKEQEAAAKAVIRANTKAARELAKAHKAAGVASRKAAREAAKAAKEAAAQPTEA